MFLMVIEESELMRLVSEGVRKTVNKFRGYLHIFFTETDIHSNLYHYLYSRKLEVNTKDNILTTCIHKEYPINYRYSKETMEEYRPDSDERRGNCDSAVLNPEFIMEFDLKNVVNTDVRDLEIRGTNRVKFIRSITRSIEKDF